jgi:putative copper resistance protein D
VAIGIASALAWLMLEAASMSGTSLAALDRKTVETVVRETLFGRVWTYRLAISFLLIVTLWLIGRARSWRHGAALRIGGTILAGAYAALLAWTGHAAADAGIDRYVHLGCDAAHLLAAGAWAGALPGLLALLGRAGDATGEQGLTLASVAARRFSTLGMVAVSALVVTGLVNSWYLVGSFSALFGTGYGRLLLWKLLLVAVMVALAAINRLRLTPRLAVATAMPIGAPGRDALTRLRRNILLELAAGIAVVGIVAALGLTIPGVHMHDHARPPATTSEAHGH